MNIKSEKFLKTFTLTLVAVLVVLSSQAQTLIYDNGVYGNDIGINLTNGFNQSIGQQIFPTLGSTPYLTDFNFEFYSASTFAANSVQVDVKFYYNNNPLSTFNGFNTPSTYFFDSGWINLVSPQDLTSGGSVATWDFQWQDLYGGAPDVNDPTPYTPALAMNTQMALPSTFTVVYSFQGSGYDANNFGLELFYPTGTGTNFDGAYWENSGASWTLATNSGAANSGIGMQLSGSATPAPEPTTIAFGAIGGLLMTYMIRRRKV